ncbi:hypothetical protein [Paraburkholderia caledonica]|nr:hypothetical protein [Paraburkholderia caledonica]
MEHLMNRLFLASLSTTGVLLMSGCTATSGPSFNAYSVDASNGVRTYRAECHGLLESAATCTKVAQHICGDKSVQPIERIDRVREADDNRNDPRVLLFSCDQASNSKTSAEPPSTVDEGARIGDVDHRSGTKAM